MAGENKQIYQLTTGEFTGESLVPFEVPNPDPTTVDEKPKVTRKGSGDAIAEFVAKVQEFQTDLETDSKTLIGSINEVNDGLSDRNNALNHLSTLANTDLDTFNTTETLGAYWCSEGNTHIPQAWGVLEVFKSGGVTNQRFTAHGARKVWSRQYVNSAWTDWILQANGRTNVTITRATGVSTSVPLINAYRRGNTVILALAQQLPAGTYKSALNGGIWKVSPTPIGQVFSLCAFASGTSSVTVLANGNIGFNGDVTINSPTYVIGELTFFTDGD